MPKPSRVNNNQGWHQLKGWSQQGDVTDVTTINGGSSKKA